MLEILVTGGKGFVGRNLIERLTNPGGNTVIVINNPTSPISNSSTARTEDSAAEVTDNCISYNADLRNQGLVLKIIKKHNIKCCIHLGAKKNIQESIESSQETMDVNVMGTLSVLDACSKCGVDSFIFGSSAAVYGNPGIMMPITEDFPLIPRSVYAASKVAGEALVHCYKQKIKNCVILRFFNVYGRGEKSSYAGAIPKLIESLKRGCSPTIFGNGFQTRDFIHVNDVVDAIIKAMSLAATNQTDSENIIFNIGTGIPTSLNELVEDLKNIMGISTIEPAYRDAVPGDIAYSCADIQRARANLDFSPRIRIQEGLMSLAL